MERATERSGLPKGARDVLFLLCRRMDQGGTYIPPQHSPSLNTIARLSGWSKRHIQRFLNLLEQLGLVIRTRPPIEQARKNHARTLYAINVPKLLQLARDRQAQEARDSTSTGLGTPQPKARDTTAAGLGTSGRGARDTTAHSQTLSDQPDHPDPEIVVIITVLRERTGTTVSAQWAAKTRDLILARPSAPKRPGPHIGYIRRALMLDKHPERWLPTPQPPPFTQEEAS